MPGTLTVGSHDVDSGICSSHKITIDRGDLSILSADEHRTDAIHSSNLDLYGNVSLHVRIVEEASLTAI